MALDDMSLAKLRSFSPVFGEDIFTAISMKTCVDKRLTLGAPGRAVMEQVLREDEEYLG